MFSVCVALKTVVRHRGEEWKNALVFGVHSGPDSAATLAISWSAGTAWIPLLLHPIATRRG